MSGEGVYVKESISVTKLPFSAAAAVLLTCLERLSRMLSAEVTSARSRTMSCSTEETSSIFASTGSELRESGQGA